MSHILTLCYLIGSITFIIGLKMLSHPAKARKGNLVAAVGMAIAIFGTIFLYEEDGNKLGNYIWIFSGLIIGTVVGTLIAKKVKMTAMPQMVSLFNGMGGACAALISVIEFQHIAHNLSNDGGIIHQGILVSIFLGAIIGSISFAGSMIAWGKLNGNIKDFAYGGQQVTNVGLMLVILGIAAYLLFSLSPENAYWFYIIFGVSLLYGVLFVMPIGGADMPVVISLLNSFTGVAAACGGFLYDNKVMLTGGILVGAAGTLLTILMCNAMNRSLKNVLLGSFGGGTKSNAGNKEQGSYKEI
jgi:NAD(P) transhydrogenase subunit beta